MLYTLAPDGTGATAVADCNGTTTVQCSFALTSGAGIVIIPGANITYHWDIADEAGDDLTTSGQALCPAGHAIHLQDAEERQRHALHYHSRLGGECAVGARCRGADACPQSVGTLEQTQVTFPVQGVPLPTAEANQPAIAPGRLGRGVITLGEVVYSDTAMVSADIDTLDITRHEVAHIVTGQATKGPYGIASWLNEGISVASQKQPLAADTDALQAAIRGDRVLDPELSSSASGSGADTVDLFYGEAGAIVKHLIDAHGRTSSRSCWRRSRMARRRTTRSRRCMARVDLGSKTNGGSRSGCRRRHAASHRVNRRQTPQRRARRRSPQHRRRPAAPRRPGAAW